MSGLPPIEGFDADPHGIADAYRPVGAGYRQDQQAWLIFRHEDVASLLREPGCRKDPRVAIEGPYGEPLLKGDYSILFMDDPDHSRIRRLVTQAFSKRATEVYRSRTQDIVDQLLDAMTTAIEPVDLISALAVPLPITVIAEILGIDPAHRDDFKRWSDDMALSFDEALGSEESERVARSDVELRRHIAEVIEARRRHPQQDLISALVAAQDADGSRLSDAEAVSVIALLLFGGNTTTTDLIGNGILALLQHPDQLELLRTDPGLIGNAVEEILRYDTSITLAERIPTDPVQIEDSKIDQGEWLCLLLSSANRDPAVHVNPDMFDIRRHPNDHLSFGGGRHYCLGAALARLETQVAIGSLVARFPKLRLAAPQSEPSRKNVPGFHGLRDLRVRLT